MTDTMMGLELTVLRPADFPDCTLNGISARHSRLVLVGIASDLNGELIPPPEGSRVVESTSDNAVVLVGPNLPGALPHFVPLSAFQMRRWTMFGGNMASGDSRLGGLIERVFNGPPCVGAVCVHDRIEAGSRLISDIIAELDTRQ
ncbi:TPA_asm: hypothetical protein PROPHIMCPROF_85 [Mycobacterium phage McProf]|nr:hypothetical protein BB28_08040 [Mycobacteroides chelonae CCUG 47445]OLT75187.1 hypothetical protein BKG56_15570 [Mycobacteroides chelonae]ORV12837.1 hypothetical protein AWB96_15815 [Mycobacteroides chelonae]VEG15755.1 Uncharacterised protein [Mycolicibacterium phlei]DAZ90073.1 TPA_asm: hypothetical protein PROPHIMCPROF_85 [Mycobacterium phage McProf]